MANSTTDTKKALAKTAVEMLELKIFLISQPSSLDFVPGEAGGGLTERHQYMDSWTSWQARRQRGNQTGRLIHPGLTFWKRAAPFHQNILTVLCCIRQRLPNKLQGALGNVVSTRLPAQVSPTSA